MGDGKRERGSGEVVREGLRKREKGKESLR